MRGTVCLILNCKNKREISGLKETAEDRSVALEVITCHDCYLGRPRSPLRIVHCMISWSEPKYAASVDVRPTPNVRYDTPNLTPSKTCIVISAQFRTGYWPRMTFHEHQVFKRVTGCPYTVPLNTIWCMKYAVSRIAKVRSAKSVLLRIEVW